MHRLTVIFIVILYSVTAAAANRVEISASARSHLAMTVYNANLAVINDQRELSLPRGDIELEFSDIVMTVQPASVSVTSDSRNGFEVRLQNYRYDLINRESLLERFIGRKLKYSRSLLEDDNYELVLREGTLLSINPEVVKFGDVIEVEPEGTISLPYMPEDLKTVPTLVLVGENRRSGKQEISVRYHATEIGWEADYTLSLNQQAELVGWVTLRNGSGSDLRVDELSLVAGQVFHQAPSLRPEMARMALSAEADGPVPQAVGDFHRYDIPGSFTVLKHDMTQLKLIDVAGISVDKSYRLTSQVQRYGNEAETRQSPVVIIAFENASRNELGVPLPAGTVRVYETGRDFIGSARIPHTAAGQRVELETGRAFDLSAVRRQKEYRRLGDRSFEAGYEIEISNAGKAAAEVTLDEQHSGDWAVLEASQSGTKMDATTYRFTLKVPGEGSARLDYRVRVSW